MPPSWRDTFLMHSETPEYRAALVDADRRIAAMEDAGQIPYVAFSGGLDSLCCLDLVARRTACVVGHYDFGRPGAKVSNVFPEWLEREVEAAVCTHYVLPLHVVTKGRNFRSPEEITAGRHRLATVHIIDDGEFWILGAQRVARELGCTCSVVGLRAQESIGRRKRLSAQGWVSLDMPECWPVAEWSDLDRWAHVVSSGLPYSRVYDDKAELDGGYMGLRMRSLFDDGRKSVSDSSGDGLLYWRDHPRG